MPFSIKRITVLCRQKWFINSGFKKKSYYKSQTAKPGTKMEIFFSFPVADPDFLKI
jgi:hypothetical protein